MASIDYTSARGYLDNIERRDFTILRIERSEASMGIYTQGCSIACLPSDAGHRHAVEWGACPAKGAGPHGGCQVSSKSHVVMPILSCEGQAWEEIVKGITVGCL